MKRSGYLVCVVAAVVGCAEPSTQPIGDASLARSSTYPSAGVTLPTSNTNSIVAVGDNLGELRDGVCGVTATLFYGGSNDLIMYTNSPSAGDRKCTGKPAGSYPRKISVVLNGVTYQGTGVNVVNIGSIGTGSSGNRQVGIPLASGPCVRVQFNLLDGGIPVSRSLDGRSYTIGGSAPALCVPSSGPSTPLGSLSVNFTAASY